MHIERPGVPWYKYSRRVVRSYPDRALLPHALVSLSCQRIYLVKQLNLISVYPVSTSRFGVGSEWGSYRTPAGMHYVAEKIGGNAPLMTRFSRRQASAEIVALNQLAGISDRDIIATRIIWLAGLEERINRGGRLDSMRRCIYIHGTVDEKRIGRPASLGCIRMRNYDVCEVFDTLQINSPVYIFK